MSIVNLHSINNISKKLTSYKDEETDSGGVLIYSFDIYNNINVDETIKKYAIQYIYYIYILIFDEITHKLTYPFKAGDIMNDHSIILYDTNFLSIQEQHFINTMIDTLTTDDIDDEYYPEYRHIVSIYENCFTLIQEYLHYEYDTSREQEEKLVEKTLYAGPVGETAIVIIERILLELYSKNCHSRNSSKAYKMLICFNIILCIIFLDANAPNTKTKAYITSLELHSEIKEFINKIKTKLADTKELMNSIQQSIHLCLQTIDLSRDYTTQSLANLISASAIMEYYFQSSNGFSDSDFEIDTICKKIYETTTGYFEQQSTILSEQSTILSSTKELYSFLDKTIDIDDEEYINQLITYKTLYINFIDEIIRLIYLLGTTNRREHRVDVTFMRDKINHIILTNRIIRNKQQISNSIANINSASASAYKENIEKFQRNYLSLATKFNSIIKSSKNNLVYTPETKQEKLPVTGVAIPYYLPGMPTTTDTLHSCGLKKITTLTYTNPSFQNLFC